jgi:hypothetical protein
LFQALYLAAAPKHDERVAGVQTIICRGRGVEVAFRGADDRGKGDHGHVKSVGETPSLEDHVPKHAHSGNDYERQNSALHPPQRQPWLVRPPLLEVSVV